MKIYSFPEEIFELAETTGDYPHTLWSKSTNYEKTEHATSRVSSSAQATTLESPGSRTAKHDSDQCLPSTLALVIIKNQNTSTVFRCPYNSLYIN